MPLELPHLTRSFGEYASPPAGAGVMFPVGTVLICPRISVSPGCDSRSGWGRPLFIASLMKAAIPVGHLESCVAGAVAATHDGGEMPFDVKSLKELCSTKTQICKESVTKISK